jgi:TRAP transporter 4TM/12TM fusion protein
MFSLKVINFLRKVISILLCSYSISHFSGLLNFFDVEPNYTAHRAIFLAFIMTLVLVSFPAKRVATKDKLPWYDIILILFGLGTCFYPVLFFDQYILHAAQLELTYMEKIFAFSAFALILESSRRVVGWPLTLTAAAFAVYPLICQYLPGVLHGRGYSLNRITQQMYLFDNGIFGIAVGVASTVVFAFVLLSTLVLKLGAGEGVAYLVTKFFGKTRGGPAKTSVVASGLVGMIMGSGVANVVATGTFTIPLMKRAGYKPEDAAAIECVASNGGHFMPPVMGAVAFLIAEFTNIPYARICIYALLPAVLYYACLLIQVDLIARRDNIQPVSSEKQPHIENIEILSKSWIYVIPIAVLIWLLFVFAWRPERSAAVALFVGVATAMSTKSTRLGTKDLVKFATDIGRLMCVVGVSCAAANVIIASTLLTGLGQRITSAMIVLSGNHLLILLLITAIACYIMGMGGGAIVIYVTVSLLIIPALIGLGIAPIAAHLFTYMMACTCFITPPVALNCFIAAPLAGASPMRVGWHSMKFGIIIYVVPFMFCYKPALLLIGSPDRIALTLITSVLGAAALACGIVGYLLRRLHWVERVTSILVGLLLLMPGLQTDIIGAVIGMAMLIWLVTSKSREQRKISLKKSESSIRGILKD